MNLQTYFIPDVRLHGTVRVHPDADGEHHHPGREHRLRRFHSTPGQFYPYVYVCIKLANDNGIVDRDNRYFFKTRF